MADMEGSGQLSLVTDGAFEIQTNSGTVEEVKENLASDPIEAPPTEEEAPEQPAEPEKKVSKDVSRAAAKLGAQGGKAAAEKRAREREAAAAEPAPSEDEPAPEKLGKPRDDPRARMLQATREAAELKRALAAERAERERIAHELNQARQRRQEPEAAPEADPNDRPRADQFQTPDEYHEALARWGVRQEYQQIQQQQYIQSQAAAFANGVTRSVESFQGRIDKVKATDPEFMDKVAPEVWDALTPSFQLGPHESPTQLHVIADEVMTSEHAPGLLLYFTEHPDVLQRLATLGTPREIARELAKVEARLEAATAGDSSRPRVSQAKPPVRPVTGSPAAADSDSEDDSFESFVARENARDFKRKRSASRL